MTNVVIDGEKLPGPQIGAIILGISWVPDGQNQARPSGDLRRKAENCEKGPLIIHLATPTARRGLVGLFEGPPASEEWSHFLLQPGWHHGAISSRTAMTIASGFLPSAADLHRDGGIYTDLLSCSLLLHHSDIQLYGLMLLSLLSVCLPGWLEQLRAARYWFKRNLLEPIQPEIQLNFRVIQREDRCMTHRPARKESKPSAYETRK